MPSRTGTSFPTVFRSIRSGWVVQFFVEAVWVQGPEFDDPSIFALLEDLPHYLFGSVFLFQLFYDGEFGMSVEIVARVPKMLTYIEAVGSWDVVPMLVDPNIHRPFAFSNILGHANNAFHQIDDPFALAINSVVDVI